MHYTLYLALLTAALLGFRHGFDYDHIAAITDVVSVQQSRSTAMRLGMIYALGHAVMVAARGLIVIFFGINLPVGVVRWAERLVGLTLLILGIYVLGTLVLKPNDLPKSRYTLLRHGFHRIRQTWNRAWNRAHNPIPHHPVHDTIDAKSVFVIGIVHGLGAETPSQLLIFLLAANLGGAALGMLGLGIFLAGLLTMNALMTASVSGVFGASRHRPQALRLVSALTATYSLIMGILFLAGRSSLLPAIN